VTVLHVELAGRPDGPPIVMAHGFTQTGRLWGPLGAALGRSHRLVLVDLPGHGTSAPVEAGLVEGGSLLVEAAAAAVGTDEPFAMLGYSLGGRFALHAALAAPDRFARLILIGAAGGIDDPEARAARRQRDESMAANLESTDDVGFFLVRWTSAPMFAGLTRSAADIEERMRNTAAGLASSLRLAGAGVQEPLWSQLADLPVPTLALAGADDPRFVEQANRLTRTMPMAVPALVAGAGHAAHLHQPDLTARIIEGWLRATGYD
jgi:2-succinyl-6-hydroxy-2,4-cyclohexadiene-1-carboxylate synthase